MDVFSGVDSPGLIGKGVWVALVITRDESLALQAVQYVVEDLLGKYVALEHKLALKVHDLIEVCIVVCRISKGENHNLQGHYQVSCCQKTEQCEHAVLYLLCFLLLAYLV